MIAARPDDTGTLSCRQSDGFFRLRLVRLADAGRPPVTRVKIRGQMYLGRLFSVKTLSNGGYQLRDVRQEDIARAAWHKSSISTYNGSCVEVARLRSDRIGVRDTKDHGAGPVLVFNQAEWSAFLAGAKTGEFDSI
jgi:Domain of unknown function (DUF397)